MGQTRACPGLKAGPGTETLVIVVVIVTSAVCPRAPLRWDMCLLNLASPAARTRLAACPWARPFSVRCRFLLVQKEARG